MKTLNPYEIRAAREKPKSVSKKQQKVLLKQFPVNDCIDPNEFDKLNDEEKHFIMVSKILNSKYAKPMNIVDFLK